MHALFSYLQKTLAIPSLLAVASVGALVGCGKATESKAEVNALNSDGLSWILNSELLNSRSGTLFINYVWFQRDSQTMGPGNGFPYSCFADECANIASNTGNKLLYSYRLNNKSTVKEQLCTILTHIHSYYGQFYSSARARDSDLFSVSIWYRSTNSQEEEHLLIQPSVHKFSWGNNLKQALIKAANHYKNDGSLDIICQ